jgi:hypothetical protein
VQGAQAIATDLGHDARVHLQVALLGRLLKRKDVKYSVAAVMEVASQRKQMVWLQRLGAPRVCEESVLATKALERGVEGGCFSKVRDA